MGNVHETRVFPSSFDPDSRFARVLCLVLACPFEKHYFKRQNQLPYIGNTIE